MTKSQKPTRAKNCKPGHFCNKCDLCRNLAEWRKHVFDLIDDRLGYDEDLAFFVTAMAGVVILQERKGRAITREDVERYICEKTDLPPISSEDATDA